VRDLLAGARDRYGMAAVRIYLPILIERDLRRRSQNRPYEQVNNSRGSGRRTAESLIGNLAIPVDPWLPHAAARDRRR
jgi:hypothetical protein